MRENLLLEINKKIDFADFFRFLHKKGKTV